MISQTAEYALRGIVCLARQPEASLTVEEAAEMTKVPVSYLSKVLQSLRRAGLVASQRGVGGGFRLAKSADAVTVLEVINAVDPIKRILSCPLELEEHTTALCSLHRKLDDAIASAEQAFAETTIGELLTDVLPIVPLGRRTS